MDADLIAMQKICAESNFEMLSFAVDSLTGDETLTCGIPADKIPCGKRNAAKKFLATYVSAKNSKPSSTVTNPTTTEGEEYDGLWRHVSEGFQVAPNKREYLVRVLKKGYATAISWTEARLVEGKDLQSSENYRTIRWLNCDAAKVNTMAASLSAASFLDPIVKTETLSGTWYNIAVQPSIADDGSGVVMLFLAKSQFTLSAYQDYLTSHARDVTYLFQVPKGLAQALITANKTTSGASASCSYTNASGLVDIVLYSKAYNATTKTDVVTAWDCAHKEFTTTYYDLTEAAADAIVLTEPPVGWRYEARKIDRGDGAWEVVIIKRQTLPRSYTSVTVEEEAGATTDQIEQIGVEIANVETVSEEAGKIVRQLRQHNDDCTVNAMTKKESGKAQTSYVRTVSPAGSSVTTIKTVQTTPLGAPVSAKGHIKKNEDKSSNFPSRYDTTEQDITPTDQVSTSGEDSGLDKETVVLHTENDNIPTAPPVSIQGNTKVVIADPTEAGNLRTREITRESKHVSVPEFLAEVSERENVYHSEEYHALDAPDIGTAAAYEDRSILSHNLDNFLTHNYKKSRSVKKFPITDAENAAGITWNEYAGTESVTVQTDQAHPEVAGSKYISHQYIYEIVYAFCMKYFRTAQEAATFIGTAETSALPDDPNANGFSSGLKTKHNDNTTSHFEKTGEYEWQATRVWKTYDLRYTWQYDDPSA